MWERLREKERIKGSWEERNNKGKTSPGKGNPGKGKRPGSGSKETRECHNCGKPGHLKKDCWSAGGGAANKNQTSKKGAKPPKKGGGKGGKGMNNFEEAEPEAETAETGYLSIAGLDVWSEEEGDPAASGSRDVPGGAGDDDDYINVEVEPEKFVMVKSELTPCVEPCEHCFHYQCSKDAEESHNVRKCHACVEEHARLLAEATSASALKTQIRAELKWRKPEAFHYVVDKTICLFKGISLGAFNRSEKEKDRLRDIHDPEKKSRNENPETLREIEKQREEYRLNFCERISKQLMEGASRTFGLAQSPRQEEPSRASGSAELPNRPVGASSGQAMRRTIELLEVSNLDAEKRDLFQVLDISEDPDEV